MLACRIIHDHYPDRLSLRLQTIGALTRRCAASCPQAVFLHAAFGASSGVCQLIFFAYALKITSSLLIARSPCGSRVKSHSSSFYLLLPSSTPRPKSGHITCYYNRTYDVLATECRASNFPACQTSQNPAVELYSDEIGCQ